jgi:Terminase large subunit, T4likevirus-type, N-terminal
MSFGTGLGAMFGRRRGSLRSLVARLEEQVAARPAARRTLDELAVDPDQVMTRANMTPDPWQHQVLASTMAQILLLCSRQAGKSTVAAALAVRAALLQPNALVLVLSPSLRQSGELFRKVLNHFNALGRPVPVRGESALRIEFANGSRVVSLPGDEGTIRGFSGVTLLIIDEAARVMDDLYCAVRPMLAVSHGKLIALSTPFGQRGWFFEAWRSTEEWERIRVTADQCPRITEAFLSEEKRALGDRWFRQEYMCSFEDTIDAVFSYEDIQAALSDDVKPLFAE